MEHPRGVRIEGDGYRTRIAGMGALLDVFKYPLVATMHAIEVAHADNGGAKPWEHLCEAMEDRHGQMANLIWRPS